MVPAPSHRISRVPWYSGTASPIPPFTYGALTLSGRSFQYRSVRLYGMMSAARTPPCSHGGLGSSPFARRYLGNRCFFLFLRLLRCFSSPGSRLHAIRFPSFTCRRTGCSCAGSPIQTPTDYRVSAAPRGFSQLAASFFGPQRQGIRPAPFFA